MSKDSLNKKYLIIHKNTPIYNNLDELTIKDDVKIIKLSDSLISVFPEYTSDLLRIGFMWDNVFCYIPFSTDELIDTSIWFQPSFCSYIKLLSEQSDKTIYIDLITCNLNTTTFLNEVDQLKVLYPNIVIEYSLNQTGNIVNSDFIMESNNISIKDIYFKFS